MPVPYYLQYHVEKSLNTKYQWLTLVCNVALLVFHGILFHWIPMYVRYRRDIHALKNPFIFKILKYWSYVNRFFNIKIPFTNRGFLFQPSLLFLYVVHAAYNGVFCYAQTEEITYNPKIYVVGKRMGRIAVGNIPFILFCIIKNDLFCAISGLQHDKLILFHKWVARTTWLLVTIHMSLCLKYWLDLDLKIMVLIPPQIFGMISYSCMTFLTWASMRFIRRWAFDFFLVQHRVFNLIMLLFAFFHSLSSKAAFILAIHMVVLDRIVSRVIGIIHKRKTPTKGVSDFEILDNETILVTIPIKNTRMNADKWYYSFIPKVGTWKAGQHIYLNVSKVKYFQYHPFTISSLSQTGEIKLIIRKQKGFTKKLMDKLITSQSPQDSESEISISQEPNAVQLKAQFYGPFGANHQPLITFDSVMFLAAGSGASFVLPVCNDLLKKIEIREMERDYLNRPSKARICLIWTIKRPENELWFQHVLDELKPYIKKGMLQVQIFITQASYETITSSSCENIEKPDEKLTRGDIRERSLSSSLMCSEIVYTRGSRPDIAKLISEEARVLINEDSNFKSFAVMGCGPDQFSNQVKLECQRSRFLKGPSPLDVYCYTESF